MKTKIFILLVLTASLSKAQNKNMDYKHAFKFYNLSTSVATFRQVAENKYDFSFSYFQFLKPTLAFQWKGSKKCFHEVEITDFAIDRNKDYWNSPKVHQGNGSSGLSSEINSTAISMRYECIYYFAKYFKNKFIPSISLGGQPYFTKTRVSPTTTIDFSHSLANLGLNGYVTPRFAYFFKSRCFLDLNIPLAIFNLYNQIETVSNPSIPVSSQKVSTFNFKMFPQQFSFRLGIGVKI